MRTSSLTNSAGSVVISDSKAIAALSSNDSERTQHIHSDARSGMRGVEAPPRVVIVERRSFVRGCIQRILSGVAEFEGSGFSNVEQLLDSVHRPNASVIVLCEMARSARDIETDLIKLRTAGCATPVVILSDIDDASAIMSLMAKGASGFMPADIQIEVAAHALRLVAAGGQYFPADTILAARRALDEPQSSIASAKSVFTKRQVAVIDALRKGKANKVIAYELNMCESTVKVHVRTIMKKLNAKNRTEVAYLANELIQEQRL